ncbi:SpaH/EbpB family LPXTG-anchored major pilin [Corynebacterium lizhenjunii]|uniref:SpaH/EbpB family LPXTG-anchored major pilin n=1 Tax=Corynebacterium lizhenjunii TaxID=2709394 RepID=A0A7T0KFT8_9CORY|nr:SpaH/EbpB family LPXTG-anchored major pilin [Corynebacterium lizhenjunii]QPK78903.1 SpaH/EbpB family LPXTG-anchored major pilin [Corynebacterium lizhenjunii]
MAKNAIALRSVSAAAVIGLSLGLGATGAVAQEGGQPAGTAAPAGNAATINQETGTLTIHKKANPETTGTPTGEVDPNVSGTPLDGVGFTFFKIDAVNLNTNAGLAAAANLDARNFTLANGQVAGATKYGEEQKTNAAGEIKLSDLPIGAYYVVETTPKDGFAPASPFIAFVPMTKGNTADGGTEWNYDVHAYPKNYQSRAEKAVEDTNKQVGQDITFSITGDVPGGLDPVNGLTKFSFVDDLDEAKVAYKTGETTKVEILGANGEVLTALAAGDFTVNHTEATQNLEVTLTDAGLKKFNDGYKTTGKKLRLSFDVTVNAHGELANKATVISNNGTGGGDTTDTTTPTNETKSYWANVKIVKKDAEDANVNLQGAEFEVYGSANETCDAADLNGDKLTVKGKDKWTTAADGTVTIEGLHVNDFDDNSAASPEQFKAYCLLETKSPAGYELLSKPITLQLKKTDQTAFTATAGDGAEAEVNAQAYELTATVKNLKDTTPKLPLTGGAGIGILAAIAAVLIGAGALYARRNTKTA